MRYLYSIIMAGSLLGCGEGRGGDTTVERQNARGEDAGPDGKPGPDATPSSAQASSSEAAAPGSEATSIAEAASIEDVNPQTDPSQLLDTGIPGPYHVASYIDGLASSDYASAIVYYPTNAKRSKLPVSTLSGGFTNTKEDMAWLGAHLASHGFAVIVFTPTTNNTLDAKIWATGHKGAIAKIKAENSREGSLLHGKLDLAHIGVSGFSMGGAGTIVAVNELGTSVQAAVPICAFNPVQPSTSVPTLFITGSLDVVAVPAAVANAYKAMSHGPKALAEFANMSHFDVSASSPQHQNIARFVTAWYLVQLMDDSSYMSYFTGDRLEDEKRLGAFAGASGFQYANR